ncbi:MAG: hypothetical protein ABJD97_07435 [Betaproteobacteria bacterium]
MATRRPTTADSAPTGTRATGARRIATLPAGRFGASDTPSFTLSRLSEAGSAAFLKRARVSPAASKLLRAAIAPRPPVALAALARSHPRHSADFQRVYAMTYGADETPLHIVDVAPRVGHVPSNLPFALEVEYQNAGEQAVVVASVTVLWAGEPFTVETELKGHDKRSDRLVVEFGREQTLPVGQAEFHVALYRADGAQASFRRTVFVLPSNPLSLSVAPAGATVTGTWSARGDYHPENDTFVTDIQVTIANGDAASVAMGRRVDWEFWDGPVGSGTRIESGNFDLSGAVTVGARDTWGFSLGFSSPRGSGVFGVYDRKEDLAVQITMTANDGRVIRGQITCRVMLAYGVNIIKVGDFGASEHTDLYAAVDKMRQVYEQRDITLRSVGRYIINNSLAGGYTVLDSENEYRDMLEDWSVPNDSVDVYVVQQFNWGGYNGYAGDIPGPASKGGRKDGVAVDKTGFTDATGTRRLDSTTLSMLIGHEVGHYLGLSHLEDTNNLMRSNTGNRGPDLNYDQYRTMFRHGFMVYL